ncbi:MAG: PAS domain S-box protein, partial [Bacteroidota bacterium]
MPGEEKKHKYFEDNDLGFRLKGFLQYFEDIYFEADLHGMIRFVSPSVKNVSGYAPEELTGMNMQDIYVNPELRDHYIGILSEKGFVKDYEVELYDKNSNIRKCTITSRLLERPHDVPTGIIGIIRD